MLSIRNPRLPLHSVADIQAVQFKPESIVTYLACLGEQRTEKEQQMLIRFLSDSRMRSLYEPSRKNILILSTLADINGPWVAIFTSEEAQEHARQRKELEDSFCKPTVVSINSLIDVAPRWSKGVALDPFSVHASTFVWPEIIREREEYDRRALWQPEVSLAEQKPQFTIWDCDLIANLQSWLQQKEGIAQIVLGVFGITSNDSKISVIIDCVPSVFESYKSELIKVLNRLSANLPTNDNFIELKICNEDQTLDRLVAHGALRIIR